MNKLIEMWDWWIYRRAFHSIRRLCKHNPGFAYVIQLWITKWVDEQNLSPELRRSTEQFVESQINQ